MGNLPTSIKSYIHRVGRTARAGKAGRSITLVGEKERKALKDVVKNARVPVKNRIVPIDVIDKYKKILAGLEDDVKYILKQEEEEKQMRIADMHVKKAENLIVHRDEIMSRPARTFIDKKKNAEEAKKEAAAKLKPNKRNLFQTQYRNYTPEQQQGIRDHMMMKHAGRVSRQVRVRAFQEDEPDLSGVSKPKKKKLNNNPSQKQGGAGKHATKTGRSFETEMTDTSKKSVKQLRYKEYEEKKAKKQMVKKKKGGFKSKAKHK